MKTTKKFMMVCCLMVMGGTMKAQQWETVLPDSVSISGGFINEDNTTELVGCSGNDGAYFRVFEDGQYETTTFPAPEGKQLVLQTLTPLDNGGYFISGRIMTNRLNDSGELKIIILDDNLNVVSEQTLQVAEGFLGLTDGAAVMDDDGTIVLLKTARREMPNYQGGYESRGALFRFSQSGDNLNCRYLLADPPDPICYIHQIRNQKLMNDPYSDQIIAVCAGRNGLQSLLYFDYDFNLTNNYFIDDISIPEGTTHKYVSDPYVGYWYNANEMLLVADQQDTVVHNKPHVLIGRMNREGEIVEKVEINKQDTLMYASCMTYANDSTIYVMADCHTESYLAPYYPQLYLINKELEILGNMNFWDNLNCWSPIILPINDGGCIVLIEQSLLYYEDRMPIIMRFAREDFNPIPCSVKEVPQKTIKALAYPNPAKEKVRIEGIEVAEVQVYNALGQLVKTVRNSNEISVAGLAEGVYLVRILDAEGKNYVARVMKE